MQTPPPPTSPQPPPAGGDAFSRFVEEFFIEGFKSLPGRIRSSPKPEPLKWYDRFPVVFASLVLFWPLGVACVWLTKRFEQADKVRLTVAGVVWALVVAQISPTSPRAMKTEAASPVSALNESEPKPNQRLPNGVYLTASGYLAGVSKEAMNRAASYQIAGDSEALAALIEEGTVFRLKSGMKVQLMETHFFSGLVEIRPMGSTVHLWTNAEAINR